MLDKILGKKDKDKKDVPDLRKDGKKPDSDIGGRLKGMVSKATEKSKEKINNNGKGEEDKLSPGKIPRPMPKPRPKPRATPRDKPTLKPPLKKQPKKKSGGLGGFGAGAGLGSGIPGGDDQRTLVGAAVFGIILIVLVGAGYYFFVYAPYQESMTAAKQTKITEVNTYFKGPLALDPQKSSILAQIDGGTTPEMVLAVDVLGPATTAWRQYQNQQIEAKKDPYGRVMINYKAGGQKNLIMKVDAAQKIVNEADAAVLSNMEIKTPDTVAVPIIITRLQAAGGLVNVGDTVDVYLTTTNTSTSTAANQTNATTPTATTSSSTSPTISGATVLAILRAKDSGAVDANLQQSQEIAFNTLTMTNSRTQTAGTDVEELLKAAASRTWNEGQVNSLLNAYGWRLSDFERASNLGELDVRYMIVLEVPRENALFLMQNSQSLQLTVPTQNAPEWMITELKRIYGTG